jgi:hypothetical protein
MSIENTNEPSLRELWNVDLQKAAGLRNSAVVTGFVEELTARGVAINSDADLNRLWKIAEMIDELNTRKSHADLQKEASVVNRSYNKLARAVNPHVAPEESQENVALVQSIYAKYAQIAMDEDVAKHMIALQEAMGGAE